MATTYKIENNGSRTIGIKVRGGIESVKPRATRTLELSEELSEESIEQFKDKGVKITAGGEAENILDRSTHGVRYQQRTSLVPGAATQPVYDPAETGGIEPKSSKSEAGGVKRAADDKTTTTKPTDKHVGPVA